MCNTEAKCEVRPHQHNNNLVPGTTLQFIAYKFRALHFTELHCAALPALHSFELHRLHGTADNCTVIKCISLHCGVQSRLEVACIDVHACSAVTSHSALCRGEATRKHGAVLHNTPVLCHDV